MLASEFFKNSICDNNYHGISIAENTELDEDFHCSTYRMGSYNKYVTRKEAICDFVGNLYNYFGSRKLSDLVINYINFDEEFDANLDHTPFTLIGYEYEDLKIFTSNIVGSINYKGSQFNINSRFGNAFLQYMIASTSGFLELEKLGNINTEIGIGEWLLIYYWKIQLKKAFGHGLYKTYQKRTDNIPTVKGSIDINKYIQKTFFDGKTVCNFTEHSYVNEINRVIFLALNKTFRSNYFEIVKDISDIFRTYQSLNFPKHNRYLLNQKVKNPYYHKYNEVYDLSVKILKNQFAGVGTDTSDFSAFLFDISLLFEHHIRKILKQRFSLFRKNLKEYTIPNGVFENNLYPDVIIELNRERKEICVYDVKYKHFKVNEGVDRNDRFQLATYVASYMNDYVVKECGFIYPVSSDESEQKYRVINGEQNLRVGAASIPFKVYLYKVADKIEDQKALDNNFLDEFKSNQVYSLSPAAL